MSNIGQAVLSIGGAFVGFSLGGVYGAQVGYLLGGYAGQVLFPTQLPGVKGPRLQEIAVQTSTIGAPIPLVFGSFAVAGNVIWYSGLIETKHETTSGGGKSAGGGEQKSTTYSYSMSMAVGICEPPSPAGIEGIRRIWADAICIYDLRPQQEDESDDDYNARIAATQQTAETLTIYYGTEDQMPDPTIESYEGAGEVQGFRGLAYVVFNEFQLERFGNRPPNFRFEVYTGNATVVDCSGYSSGRLYPWQYMIDPSVQDPRNPANYHLYRNCIDGVGSPAQTFETALASMNATLAGVRGDPSYVVGKIPQSGDSQYIRGWANTSTPNYSQPCDSDSPSAPDLGIDRVRLTMNLNTIREDANSCRRNESSDGYGCNGLWTELGGYNRMAWFSSGDFSGFHALTLDNVHPTDAGLPPAAWDGRGDCNPPGPTPVLNKWGAFDQEMCVRRWHEPTSCANFGTPISGTEGFCIVDGVVTGGLVWTRVGGTFKALRPYDDDGSVVTSYPVDPTLHPDDPDYSNQAFWEAAYADALADPTIYPPIPEGWVYGVDYPTTIFSHATNTTANSPVWESSCNADVVELDCVPVAGIVSRICERAGLPAYQVDVTDIGSCVMGYAITSQMSARDMLTPLMSFGLFDAVESGIEIKFIERGHAPVATLTEEELAAHLSGEGAPSIMETTRVMETALPQRLTVKYVSPDREYEVGEQAASRVSTRAEAIDAVEMPISMLDETAAQLAEIMLYQRHAARNTYVTSVGSPRMALEPTDCVLAPVDGQLERMRIIATDYSLSGVLKLELVRDDDGSYVSTAVPATPPGSGGGIGAGGNIICDVESILLDLPSLQPTQVDGGYQWAAYSTCGAFRCAALYRSPDGGETYEQVATTFSESTVGTVLSLDTGGYELRLDSGGPLESRTEAQLDAGANFAAVGADGRWYLFQYGTATLETTDTWILSDIRNAGFGTEAYADLVETGDRFVLLRQTDIVRIPETPAACGVVKYFKSVACDQSVDSVTPFTFTTQCLSYVPAPLPDSIISATTEDAPLLPANDDAYLIPCVEMDTGTWTGHQGYLARWSDQANSWLYTIPPTGKTFYVQDTASYITYNGPCDDTDGGVGPPPWIPSGIVIYDEGSPVANFEDLFGIDIVGEGVSATLDSSGILTIEVTATGTGGGGNGCATTAYQENTLSITNNTTFQDTDLAITLDVGLYAFDLFVYSTSHFTPDYKQRLHFTGTAIDVASRSESITNSGLTGLTMNEAFDVEGQFTTSTNNTTHRVGKFEVTSPGVLVYQAAQVSSSATAVSVNKGSWLRVWDLTCSGGDTGSSINIDVDIEDDGTPIANLGDIPAIDFGAGLSVTQETDGTLRVDAAGDGDASGPASSTDNAIARFDGTTGKLLQDSSSTLSDAGVLATPNNSADELGYKGIPQNSQTSSYQLVLADAGKCIYKGSGGSVTITIPANGTVAFPIGTCIEGINDDTENLTIAITTDTLVLAATGATGSRTVSARGWWAIRKVDSTRWYITGAGVL